jgi:hypothetical protein
LAKWPAYGLSFSCFLAQAAAVREKRFGENEMSREESVLSQGAGRMLAAVLEALWKNPRSRKRLLAIRKNSVRVFGLNIVAEANFNSVFDEWYRQHSKDIL